MTNGDGVLLENPTFAGLDGWSVVEHPDDAQAPGRVRAESDSARMEVDGAPSTIFLEQPLHAAVQEGTTFTLAFKSGGNLDCCGGVSIYFSTNPSDPTAGERATASHPADGDHTLSLTATEDYAAGDFFRIRTSIWPGEGFSLIDAVTWDRAGDGPTEATTFEDGFEDGTFDRWEPVELPEKARDRSGNDWEITDEAISGDHSLTVTTLGDNDDNAIATKERLVDLSSDVTIVFEWLTTDASSRGPRLDLLDAEGQDFEGRATEEIFPEGGISLAFDSDAISSDGSPYDGNVLNFCGEEVTETDLETGEVYSFRIATGGDIASLDFDGEHVHDVDGITADGRYRVVISTSGTWGNRSNLTIDNVVVTGGSDVSSQETSTVTQTATATPTPTATAQPTRTRTPTPQPTATNTPTATPDEIPYDLGNAALAERVTVGDEEYRILFDIPDVDASRLAVTTHDDDLVSPAVARDALIVYVWLGGEGVDWSQRIERTEEAIDKWQILESLSNIASISTDVAAALALATISPTAAIRSKLSALETAISWQQDAINDPYREQFSKIAESTGTMQWSRDEFSGLASAAQLSQDAIDVLDFAVEVYDQLDTVREVAAVADTAIRVASNTDSITTGLIAGGDLAAARGFQMFSTMAATYAVDEYGQLHESNARTAAVGASYNTIKLSILRELEGLQDAMADGRADPPDIARYYLEKMVHYQIEAAGMSAMAEYQGSIDESLLGSVLAAVFNSEEIEAMALDTHHATTDLARHSIAQLGSGWRSADTILRESINVELLGDGGGA